MQVLIAVSALVLAAGVVAVLLLGRGDGGAGDAPGGGAGSGGGVPAPTSEPLAEGDVAALAPADEDRPRGGTASVAVPFDPDPAAPGLGGAAVRALVLPQLFTPAPDGRWITSLVVPGTDRTSVDRRSARFRLQPSAVWSDGSPITVDDLRRSADARFVASVDGPAEDGTITVSFTQPLPGWRRLWSGVDAIAAPRPDVWGGPFTVVSRTAGLELVLARNDSWVGGPGPFLDELRLVLVPDLTTAGELLEAGRLDVLAPPAFTARIRQLEDLSGVEVVKSPMSGWWLAVLPNAGRLDAAQRSALLGSADRHRFTEVLLKGEAMRLDGLPTGAGAPAGRQGGGSTAGGAFADFRAVPPSGEGLGALRGGTVDIAAMVEEPMSSLLLRSMQQRVRAAGGTFDLRIAEWDLVEGWLAAGEYGAAVVPMFDGPVPCHLCRWGPVDEALARAADGGDAGALAALEVRLRDEARVLPLWRSTTAVAVRDGLRGVEANGWLPAPVAGAWRWWREPAG